MAIAINDIVKSNWSVIVDGQVRRGGSFPLMYKCNFLVVTMY